MPNWLQFFLINDFITNFLQTFFCIIQLFSNAHIFHKMPFSASFWSSLQQYFFQEDICGLLPHAAGTTNVRPMSNKPPDACKCEGPQCDRGLSAWTENEPALPSQIQTHHVSAFLDRTTRGKLYQSLQNDNCMHR